MIQPGSLLGFGLVFLAVSWAGSALLGGVLLALRMRLRQTGPRAERALSAAALIAPPFAAATLVVSLAGLSLVQGLSGRGDHCTTHDHHLHLCLQHGSDWAENTVAVIALLLLGSVVIVGLVRRLLACRATSDLIREIERHAVARNDLPADVSLVPSETPLCVTAGVRNPRILVSTASWDLLDEDERRAVFAHERAHIEHGDTRWRFALSLLGAFGPPGLGSRLLAIWIHASERLCDWRASTVVEEPAVVAQALVRLARASSMSRATRIAETLAFASPESVADRVEAILDAEPDGAALGSRALTALAVAAVSHSVATILFAGPLHHLLETLLHVN